MPKQATPTPATAVILLGALLLAAGSARPLADGEDSSTGTNSVVVTNAPTISEAQNQEMIRQAIEQIRRETTLASRQLLDEAARHAGIVAQRVDETLTARLTAVERSIAEQYRRDREAMQESNRTLLLIAGCFGVVGVLGILTAAAIIVRAMNRLSEVALALPNSHGFSHSPAPTILDAGIANGGQNQLDQATLRFLGAIDRLEKRIHELELTAQPDHIDVEHHSQEHTGEPAGSMTAIESGGPDADSNLVPRVRSSRSARDGAAGEKPSQASILVGKGQTLLNLGQAEEALGCFDEAIHLDPKNADALVKKGMALEKLQRMEEALASYDRAIATNSSLTLAYLYKGAVCNRLQRFREALECYEKALKTEQKPVAS